MVGAGSDGGQERRYTPSVDTSRERAEQLLSLSSGARRVADLVAAAEQPLRYEVMRHVLRVSEETMTEVLEEAVSARLVRRGADPFSYIPANDEVGSDIRESLGSRIDRLREQISGATRRVFE
jgi:hypothetical protein